ncbi:hypothetical protein HY78_18275 [Rhizorhabdus wittichii DC-6]|nr:hypothetical protein HY78_18275 [Rhizorhabdus wittichii DC-6]
MAANIADDAGRAIEKNAPKDAFAVFDGRVGLTGPDTLKLWGDIETFGLAPYIGELDVKGYTVVPPHIAQTIDLHPRLLNKILDIAERRTGARPSLSGDPSGHSHGPLGNLLSYLLFEDEVFREALLNPVVLTFLTYLLGSNASLSSMQAQLKGTGNEDLPLHADNVVLSSPFPAHHQLCNVSINLTDYTMENGPICLVPGSHKLYRHPLAGEAIAQRVGVEAPAGSFIIFSGNTWHGAFARKAPGVRASMLMQFVRPHVRAFEAYREDVSQEMLDRYPPRFAKLMGRHINHGWREKGPMNTAYAYNMGAHAYD